jgi:integral membrane protein TIGR01906
MKKKQNIRRQGKGYLFFGVLAMFLLVVSLLLTSFQIAIYGDSKYHFYEEEYRKYRVTESLGMELSDVMTVTDHMMDYLIGREEKLSIETDVDGKRQDFFNEQDRLHMADVKNLFLGGLKLRTLFFLLSVIFIGALVLKKADMRNVLPRAYGIAMAVFAAVLVFLGIAFTVDFTRCFTIFHEMFFTNDLWMFDESTDYMIRMLPEGFFSDMVIRIVKVFVGCLAALGVVIGIIYKICDRHTAGKENVI